jgi:hypothetical protein
MNTNTPVHIIAEHIAKYGHLGSLLEDTNTPGYHTSLTIAEHIAKYGHYSLGSLHES